MSAAKKLKKETEKFLKGLNNTNWDASMRSNEVDIAFGHVVRACLNLHKVLEIRVN